MRALILALVLSFAATARAQDAEALASDAQSAYREGRFEEAAALFFQAYELAHAPSLLYNQARALENAGHVEEAIAAYQRYLEADPAASDRAGIEERTRRLEAARAERQRLESEREALERALAERARAAPPPPREVSPFPWITLGVGIATLGVGTGLGIYSYERYQAALVEPTQAGALAASSEANDFGWSANVLFIAGGVLALSGLVWGIVELVTANTATAAERVLEGGAPIRF